MNTPITVTAKSRSVVVFFLLAFGISWAVWIPAALGSYGNPFPSSVSPRRRWWALSVHSLPR